jgi:Phage integrase family
MTTAARSTAIATIQPVFTGSERLALAGFPAGYRSLTRKAYALDLRQFTSWCRARSLSLFTVRRANIESSTRDLEGKRRARATVTRRLCTIAGSTGTRSRKSSSSTPRPPMCGGRAWITSRMRPPWSSANERTCLFFWPVTGGGRTGTAPGGSSARWRRAGITKAVTPHTLRTFITAALDAGVPLRDVQEAASHADPRTTMRYDKRARGSLDRHATCVAGAAR